VIMLGSLTAGSNYAITVTPGVNFTITPAPLTITANSQNKIYGNNDPTLTFTQSGLVNGVTVDGVQINDTLTGSLSRADYGTLAGEQVGNYAIGQGSLAPSSNNYTVGYTGANLTITPASLTIAPNAGQSKIYGNSDPTFGFSATGFVSRTVDGVAINDSSSLLSGALGRTAGENVGNYAYTFGTMSAGSNYTLAFTTNPATFAINPATLYYVAYPSIQTFGVAFSPFAGTVTGFVRGDTQTSATTGALTFTTTATSSSPPGSYAIDGSGLTANFGNYIFVQAAGNAGALTLNPAPANSPSQFTPTSNTLPPSQVAINFSTPNTGTNFARVSFTPNGQSTANNQNNDNNNVNPASLPPGDRFMHNHGLYFPPISQYDADQYSSFKLPPYDGDNSEATVLTIIARGIAQTEAAKYMIDGFWNGSEDTWPGATHVDLLGKATFSDGAGHNVTPTNDAAFPIVPGKTDFAALLRNGPVMIGGPANLTPPQWLLAVGMTPDGKGIVCDDTQTGGLVELAYDPATKTIGGITSVFDGKTNRFVALADAGNDIPANDANGLSGLQSFVPSTYYAITVH
jgi:hypothetical protein